ncbi:hypothetical protein DEU56DRAFT_779806 [Suillus clintonianus]|uniref:uncharacterized protein n=1 Tax=Suillus clintonianus TaxID=1904413 RepID=UPI001B87B2C3|nr:uncharacterized protein DEU56DRAFT_779806 [Suillus clintonianus]KAG2150411.1 hypothetical protein DEU56DRAFT_779806 [Suillus clintonianus]
MAMKRKLDFDASDDCPQVAKQLKMVPFPNYEPDADVAMSESPSSDAVSFFPENNHTRLHSTASSSSGSSLYSEAIDYSSPLYPRLAQVVDYQPDDSSKAVGLLQPASSFTHHGSHCSQIPKLRVACSAGSDGSRTMWSFCEQCGAISMVDSD